MPSATRVTGASDARSRALCAPARRCATTIAIGWGEFVHLHRLGTPPTGAAGRTSA